MVGEAQLPRGLCNRVIGAGEPVHGALDPAADHVAVGEEAGRGPEDAGEVERAQAGRRGHVRHRQVLAEPLLDQIDDAAEAVWRKAAARSASCWLVARPDENGPNRLHRAVGKQTINRFIAHPGKRDELITAMTSDADNMEGCHSFVMADDATDPDVMWLTEVWENKAFGQASVDRPGVKASINIAVPLVKDWGTTVETEVVKVLPG